MCGRTALNIDADQICQSTGLQTWIDQDRYRPSTNVAPTRHQPVIVPSHQFDHCVSQARRGESPKLQKSTTPEKLQDNVNDNKTPFFCVQERQSYWIKSMKWGLTTSVSIRMRVAPINARDDSVVNGKPMFAPLRQSRRCVVIAQGFFEWTRIGKEKTPYYVTRDDGRLLYMAGLWNEMTVDGDTEPTFSYSIITTDNTPTLGFLHDRMPVLLDHHGATTWLATPKRNETPTVHNGGWNAKLAALLRPNDDGLKWFRVHPDVGKAGTESLLYLEPYTEQKPKTGTLMAFFDVKCKDQQKSPGQRLGQEPHNQSLAYQESSHLSKIESGQMDMVKPYAKDSAGVKRRLVSPVEETTAKRQALDDKIIDGCRDSETEDVIEISSD